MQAHARWVAPLLLIALLARVVAALAVGGGFHFPDEAIYYDAARRLTSGEGFGSDYRNVPGYPVFLAILSLGDDLGVRYLRVAQAVVSAFGTLLVWLLADRMFGERAALVAAGVYALDPLLVVSSGLLYPETVAALFVAVIVLAAVDAVERDAVGRSALAGLLLGVLAQLRPVALILPLVVAGWMAVVLRARPVRRLAHVGVLTACFAVALLPWTVRGLRVQGRFVPVATAGSAVTPAGGENVARDGVVTSMARWAWREPAGFASHVSRQFFYFWELRPTRLATDVPEKRAEFHEADSRLSTQPLFSRGLRDLVSSLSFGLELTLAVVGLAVALRTRTRLSLLPVALMLVYALGYALFVAKLRYRIPILPLLFAFTGLGVAMLLTTVTSGRSRPGPDPGQGRTL